MDALIPIVFPDYKILVDIRATDIDIFPAWKFDNFRIPRHRAKYSNLGHAGVLIINGKNGLSRYYEYGRYDRANIGLVRRVPIPNAKIENGDINILSLKPILRKISRIAGQNGRIEGVYIRVKSKFQVMQAYAISRKNQNGNASRKPYDFISNSCIHFVKQMANRAGISTPWMIDPRPNSYIGEFKDDFWDLDYSRNSLTIESKGSF